MNNKEISNAMTVKLSAVLPPEPVFQEGIRRAPDRGLTLTKRETKIALENALRYIPEALHETLAPEFLNELKTMGRIYGYRYRPAGSRLAFAAKTITGEYRVASKAPLRVISTRRVANRPRCKQSSDY